jgi:hypothetical protein
MGKGQATTWPETPLRPTLLLPRVEALHKADNCTACSSIITELPACPLTHPPIFSYIPTSVPLRAGFYSALPQEERHRRTAELFLGFWVFKAKPLGRSSEDSVSRPQAEETI